jgi:lipoprotein-anchoring transpeptidase ErfK/SrfK
MKTTLKTSFIILALIGFGVFFYNKYTNTPSVSVIPSQDLPLPVVPIEEPKKEPISYKSITLVSDKPGKEVSDAVGFANLDVVLSLNRIDQKHFQKGMTIVYPDRYDDIFALSSFPKNIPELSTVPKMMLIAQKEQEFGAYEYGELVRFGGLSSGKKSTPTTSKLFYANWKGKEVISTVDDSWIMKWNVNIANKDGIGIHEYDLPGYPASHSCVRLSAKDALWFYDWVDTWVLSKEEKLLAQGTPVLIFGDYAFGQTAPWKKLAEDPNATKISLESLQEKIKPLLEDIQKKQEERDLVLNPKTEEN